MSLLNRFADNYEYWRRHGSEWGAEYKMRKRRKIYFHIQELMLTEYIEDSHPAKVLEFGCGVGRHLRNLVELQGIEVHGYDQSQAMVDEMREWASPDWMGTHITVGEPVGRLPYPDGAFDIVYSSEVLIHVRPEDLPGILSELVRISRWQVLHFEPPIGAEVVSDAHAGCWSHNLPATYASFDLQCEVMEPGFAAQIPYRVVLDPTRPTAEWSQARLKAYRQLEIDVQPGLDTAEHANQFATNLDVMIADRDRLWNEVQLHAREAATLRQHLATMTQDRDRLWEEAKSWHAATLDAKEALGAGKAEIARLSGDLLAVRDDRAKLTQANAESAGLLREYEERLTESQRNLDDITRSIGWRILQRVRRSASFRAFWRVGKRLAGRDPLPSVAPAVSQPTSPAFTSPGRTVVENWNSAESEWLIETTTKLPVAIAVCHPDWRGIRSSAENLFTSRLLVNDTLDTSQIERTARLFAATGCRKLVFNGFPSSYEALLHEVKRLSPQTQVYAIWYSSFLQLGEDANWAGLGTLDRLNRSGLIEKVGFAKHGMAEILAPTGLRAEFVMSCVRRIPASASAASAGGPHLGIWAIEPIWRKLPYAMLAACATVPGATVHATGHNERSQDLAKYLGIQVELQTQPLPQELMPQALSRMHLNLYVTLSECAPMLPLESLAAGTPCLIGPTSHYFEDDEYLRSRLVVPYPDRAWVIGRMIRQALTEREAIIDAYRAYAPHYNERAGRRLRDFLDAEADAHV